MLIGPQIRFHLCDMVKQISTDKYSYASEPFDQKQTFHPSLYYSEREDLLLVPGRIVPPPSISVIWSFYTKMFSFRILLLSGLAALLSRPKIHVRRPHPIALYLSRAPHQLSFISLISMHHRRRFEAVRQSRCPRDQRLGIQSTLR